MNPFPRANPILFVILMLIASSASAGVDTLGNVAKETIGSWQSVMDLLSGIAYLAGAIFAVRSLILLKDNTDNPGQVRLSRPLMAFATATLLLTLPSVVTMFAATALGPSYSELPGRTFLASSEFEHESGASSDATDLSGMAVAFGESLPQLKKLVVFVAVLMGVGLILRAIFLLPQLEQGRAEPSKVLWTLIAGVMLWSVLPMIEVALGTLGNPTHTNADGQSAGNILAYGYIPGGGTEDKFRNTIKAVLMFIQFIGLIAFVRGGLILKSIGEHKDGSMGRAITHIFGGAAAINITWAVWILANTIGAGWICSDTNSAGQANPLSVLCEWHSS